MTTYALDVLVQGFPGRSGCHGSLGWSTVSLLRSDTEVLLVDTGDHMYRQVLKQQLESLGLTPQDVTGVLLTHCHSDHMCNYPMFTNATVYVPSADLDWACEQPVGTPFVPEFHVEKLRDSRHVRGLVDAHEVLPGITTLATPGHTPGHMAYVATVDGGAVVFAGDAVKNQAELSSGESDMTLDAAASRRSIADIRDVAQSVHDNIVVPGHDRLLSIHDNRVVGRTPLVASVVCILPTGAQIETDIAGPMIAHERQEEHDG